MSDRVKLAECITFTDPQETTWYLHSLEIPELDVADECPTLDEARVQILREGLEAPHFYSFIRDDGRRYFYIPDGSQEYECYTEDSARDRLASVMLDLFGLAA